PSVDLVDLADDVWELYDTSVDWSQSRDLAAEHPELLERLKTKFIAEAARYDVLPLDDCTVGRVAPRGSRPPHPMEGRTSITLCRHMRGSNEKAEPPVCNRAFQLTASLDVREPERCEGVLLCLGGRFVGLALYVAEVVPVLYYNFFDRSTGE